MRSLNGFRPLWIMVLVAIGLLVLASCGGSDPTPTSPAPQPTATPTTPADSGPAPTATSVPAPTSADRIAELYEKAKAEGELTILTQGDAMRNLAEGPFADKFPGIKINIQTATTPERPTKIIAEYQANKVTSDILTASAGVASSLIDRGYLACSGDVDWDLLGFTGEYVMGGGCLPVYSDFVYAHEYNTDLVDASDLPQSFEDFLDPRWKGKIAASPFLYFFGFGFVALERGLEEAQQLAKRIAEEADLTLSNAYVELLETGEKELLFFGSLGSAIQSGRDGAPVDYFFAGEHGVARVGMPITRDAPHPNVARLFNHWLGSPDGQAATWEESASIRVGADQDNEIRDQMDASGQTFVFESDANWKERSSMAAKIREFVLGQ